LKSTNNRASLIVAILLTAAIAGAIGWTMRSRVTAVPGVADAGGIDSATTEGAQPANAASQAAPNGPSLLAKMPSLRRDPRAMIARNNQNVSKLIATGRQKLKSSYDGETVDTAWAQRKQKALEAASTSPQIEEIDAKPLSFDAHCRTTTCLIGADFASVTAATDWFTLYTMIAGPEMTNAAVQRSVNPDGSVHLQVYGKAR